MNTHRIYAAVGIGLMWGLMESGLGPVLKTTCSSGVSGSVLCGTSFFFLAMVYALWRSVNALLIVLSITIGIKMLAGLLMGLPLTGGAIANPVFAFVTETFCFLAVVSLMGRMELSAPLKGSIVGIAAALASVLSFPLVIYCTGIPACVKAGIPLAYYYGYVAVGIAAIAVPLGQWVGSEINIAGFAGIAAKERSL